jgi:hypothetical protein
VALEGTPEVIRVSETEEPTTTSGIPESAHGPIGRQRGVAFVIVLSIVTFGIYHFYWVFKSFDEMQRHTGHGLGGVLALVVAILVDPVIWFVMPSEVGRMYREDGQAAPMTGWTGLWMFLPIAGWFVWIIKIQGALNRYWEGQPVTA